MRNNVRLGCRVAIPTLKMEKDGAAARRMKADVVALCSEGMRFIERNPILHSIAKLLKARLGENREILSANLKGGN